MGRRGTGPAAALGAALLVLVLGGCGSSGSGDSTGTSGNPSTGAETAGTKAGEGPSSGGAERKGAEGDGGSTGPAAKVQAAPLKVSGGGSAQYRVQGGDNSVQEFGEEGGETELEEAASALHGYLAARAEEDWPAACAELAESVKDQLRALASRSEGLKGKGCAAILAGLTPPLPASVRRESTVVDAGSLRKEGDQAFLIYNGASGSAYTVLMVPEDGGWKVGSLAATPLS